MRTFKEFFGFHQEPFKSTPDLSFYHPTNICSAVLDTLFDFINLTDNFAIMIGEAGAGKTFLIKKFLSELPTNIIGSYVLYPNLTLEELLVVILEEFDIQADKSLPKNELIIKLKEFLKDIKSQEKKAVIVFDEAQNLSNEILEELYSLSNLDENHNLKILLLGQPELNKKLHKDSFKQLIDKGILNIKLNNLNHADIKDYIYSHINKAGANQIKIKNSVIKHIGKATSGNPRMINTVMEKTIVAAFLDNSYTITDKHLFHALSSLNYITGNIHKKRITAKPVLISLISILVIIALFFNKDKISDFQETLSSTITQSTSTEEEVNVADSLDSDIAPQEMETIAIAENTDNQVAHTEEPILSPEPVATREPAPLPEVVSELAVAPTPTPVVEQEPAPAPVIEQAPEMVQEIAPATPEIASTPEVPATPEVIEEQVEVTQKVKEVYISANSLNVRATPSLNAARVTSATTGQVYEYVSENDEWVEIRISPTTTGWVFKQYARIVERP